MAANLSPGLRRRAGASPMARTGAAAASLFRCDSVGSSPWPPPSCSSSASPSSSTTTSTAARPRAPTPPPSAATGATTATASARRAAPGRPGHGGRHGHRACTSRARCSTPGRVPTPLTLTATPGSATAPSSPGSTWRASPSVIVWNGGRPFVLASGPGVTLDPVVADLAPTASAWPRQRRPQAVPGAYQLNTPVAVGGASTTPAERDTSPSRPGRTALARRPGRRRPGARPTPGRRAPHRARALARLKGTITVTQAGAPQVGQDRGPQRRAVRPDLHPDHRRVGRGGQRPAGRAERAQLQR